jgi:hypothetical protein
MQTTGPSRPQFVLELRARRCLPPSAPKTPGPQCARDAVAAVIGFVIVFGRIENVIQLSVLLLRVDASNADACSGDAVDSSLKAPDLL